MASCIVHVLQLSALKPYHTYGFHVHVELYMKGESEPTEY